MRAGREREKKRVERLFVIQDEQDQERGHGQERPALQGPPAVRRRRRPCRRRRGEGLGDDDDDEEPTTHDEDEDEDDECTIEGIVDELVARKRAQFRVRWKGSTADKDEWKTAEELLETAAATLLE